MKQYFHTEDNNINLVIGGKLMKMFTLQKSLIVNIL